MDRYRYYISLAGEEVEISPLGSSKIKFETSLEQDQVFYRTKLQGKLKLIQEDFTYLYAIEQSTDRCAVLTLRIESLCGGDYTDFWSGTFSCNDVRFDIDNHVAEFEPTVLDKYSCVINNRKKPVNVLELATILSTEADLEPLGLQYSKVCVGQVYLGGHPTFPYHPSGSVSGPTLVGLTPDTASLDEEPVSGEYINDCVVEEEGWQIYKVVYRDKVEGVDEWTCETTFFRQIVETKDVLGVPSEPLGDGWVNVESSEINGEASTLWARRPFGGTEETYTTSYQGVLTSNYRRIVTIKECKITDNQTNFIYDKCRSFNDVLWFVANKYCGIIPGLVSDFFSENTDDTYPDNEAYQKAKQYLSLLTISQKSDVKKPAQVFASEAVYVRGSGWQQTDPITKTYEGATKGFLTWDQVEEMLKNIFNCYWDIDDNGNLRVEHLSYWASQGVFDLTVEKYKDYVRGKNKYEHEKVTMPQLERFEFMEKSYDVDFLGAPIEYDSACVNQDPDNNERIYQASQITTDLNLIYAVKEGISDDGFVIFQNYIDTEDEDTMKVQSEQGYISGLSGVNKHLSWANLHFNYHRWGRVLNEGVMNYLETDFVSAVKTKRQDLIKIKYCCDDYLNPKSFFVTGLGTQGQLRSMVHNIVDNTLELLIYHPVETNGESAISRQFDDSFDLSFK